MAAYHVRSNSLPSTPHPFFSQIEINLGRIRASEGTPSSLSSINHNLSGLQDLHDCFEKLLLLPLTQRTLVQEEQPKWSDPLLDGSLRLLDVCSTAKDSLLQTKECTQELLPIIRRRGGVETEAKKFLASRKVIKKAIHRAIGRLESMQKQRELSSSNADQETMATVSMLREVEAVTLNVFKSFLLLISGSKPQLKPSRWSAVSKLTHLQRAACKEENASEFGKVVGVLRSLCAVESVQNHLKILELCIQDLEGRIECLYRQMIKTRVSLLNTLSH
ncbi:uncharacterized protein LOC110819089 [Carica papaya]|uniref:uncharacterized protein LOC110819089 n=1 Tax=Carica papaya TaxID=3649 RepID=UPI000B8C83EE|nr:uncharacterized protein LOC110819089 [Carica papaya]